MSNFSTVSANHLRYTGTIGVWSTPTCLEASSLMVSSMNLSSLACSDMWGLPCGEWEETHPLPAWRSKWDTLQDLRDKAVREKSRVVTSFSHEPSQVSGLCGPFQREVQPFQDTKIE